MNQNPSLRRNARSRLTAVGLVLATLLAGCGDSDGASGAAAAAHPGEQTYNRYCFSCHAAGVAGAPRVGDAVAWAARVDKGREALLQSTITGIPPGMPVRGLCTQCSDQQLAQAIDYMVSHSQ
ncbi:MAG: c-type cytochrome [Pseudomonadales bacterium]